MIIARRSASGVPHFLMQERAEGMRFAGGAMVFPGGAVDAADVAHARALGAGDDALDEMAARIAAVRETIEECGLALTAAARPIDARTTEAIRDALKSGRMLAEVAVEQGVSFDFTRLVPFARWCPSARAMHRRFDTRFFLTVLEEGEAMEDLLPDGSESVRLAWHSAHEVLEEADAGRARIIFPTRRNLERLARWSSLEELVDHAVRTPVRLISPWIEARDDGDYLCIPEGLGYPVTCEALSTAERG